MTKVFIRVLNMSLTGGIVILAVLLLRLFLKKAPKIFSYCLWAAVLFRLLCPVSFTAGFSPFAMLKAPFPQQVEPGYLSVGLESEWQPVRWNRVSSQSSDSLSQGSQGAADEKIVETGQKELPIRMGAVLWILGASLLAGSSVRAYLKLKRHLKGSVWVTENIYTAPSIATPFVTGIFRPSIYLPSHLGAEGRAYALLHEQVHIRRGDHILKLIGFLALCIHWFNPLVWAAFILSSKDMEMSCDEAVIRKMGASVKKGYANTLLAMATGKAAISGTPLAFGEGDVGSRIKNVLRYRQPAAVAVKALTLICAACVAILLANPSVNAKTSFASQKAAGSDVKKNPAKNKTAQPKQNTAQNQAAQPKQVTGKDQTAQPKQSDVKLYEMSIRSIAQKERTVDSYVPPFQSQKSKYFKGGRPLAIADNCQFLVNFSMNRNPVDSYQEVTFGQFADLVNKSPQELNKPCMVQIAGGQIVSIALKSAWYDYGISPADSVPYATIYDTLAAKGESAFSKHYSKVSSKRLDIADRDGMETVETYISDDKDSGVVLIRDKDGQVLNTQDASTARAGWKNIYVGSTKEGGFILNVGIEDRFDYGLYSYSVYRLDQEGKYLLGAGSEFEFHLGGGSDLIYDDSVLKEWLKPMGYYLQNSQLVLSTQDGAIRTEAVSEAGKYNYGTLNLKGRALEISASDKDMVHFHDNWYSKKILPEKTVEWLSWYNQLPEEEQLAVSAVPKGLLDWPNSAWKAQKDAAAGNLAATTP